jgi:hypothetical protein
MKTKITISLTDSQIRHINYDKTILAQIINSGQCCKFHDDTNGLSVIDLYALHVVLTDAIRKQNTP